jgi:hypothetical protein
MLVLAGMTADVPGVRTISMDQPGGFVLSPGDCRRRQTAWIRSIVIHATVGDEPQVLLPGAGAPGLAARTIEGWDSDPRHAGAHLVVDADGTVYQVADLVRTVTYHAESINEVSIGIELAQTHKLELRQVQLDVLVLVLDRLTALLGIQRQYHAPYLGEAHPVARLAAGGHDAIGIFGHRDQTVQRGPGDPGDAVFAALAAAGYEAFDFDQGEDRMTWMQRQGELGVAADGIPGTKTVAALAAAGRPRGMWVSRPGDTP